MDHEIKTFLLTSGSPEDWDRTTFTVTAIITKVVDILINYDHNNFVFAGSALLFNLSSILILSSRFYYLRRTE